VSGGPLDTVLVVARAPVPGMAKTRLAATTGAEAAADLAAAALLDTLAAARSSGARVVVAMAGDLSRAARGEEVRAALQEVIVVGQRGVGLAERLANAHSDAHASAGGTPAERPAVFQVGMDTPQLTAAMLVEALAAARSYDAVLGEADDGGWWGLGVSHPDLAAALVGVAVSTPSTGRLTAAALRAAGVHVHALGRLRDVDEWPDAVAVAAQAPAGRFAAAVVALSV